MWNQLTLRRSPLDFGDCSEAELTHSQTHRWINRTDRSVARPSCSPRVLPEASPSILNPSLLRQKGTIWLDTARPDVDTGNSRGFLFAKPYEMLTARTAAEIDPLLKSMQEETARGNWVAGLLPYEVGYVLEPTVFAPPEDGPLGWFGVYEKPIEVSSGDAETLLADSPRSRIASAQFGIDRDDYTEQIGRIRAHIAAGDVYQVNFTAPFRFQLEGDSVGLYAAIRQRQRAPYGAFLNLGDKQVLSFSPELFFRMQPAPEKAGRWKITTRPMKGTTHRSTSSAEDDHLADALFNDEKNRAENLMIVDLLRNDLSRVSEAGSVRVPELFTIERYETVTQMTSTVEGTLKQGVGLSDALRALFPCGSVTGAPKIRAMQLIRELEGRTRGVYCGAIGFAGPNGEAAFSVPIRTVVLSEGEDRTTVGELGVGSGVVWDSEAGAEYDECLLKARFLTEMAA